MHKDDQMTPKERALALSKGEAVDRMPISLLCNAPSHRLLGLTADALFANSRSFADLQKKVYETYGQDGVTAKYGLHSMGISFGATVLSPPDSNRAIINHPLRDIRDQSMLDIDRLTVKKDKDARRTYESAQILLEELGDEVGCNFGATGPFTNASALMGAENLMRAVVKYPEELHQLLRFTTAAMLQITKPFLELGCNLGISEPMASGTLLSERNFRRFVLPYLQEYIRACRAMVDHPIKISMHICGDTTQNLVAMAESGVDTLSLDNMVDLADAKERIGDKVTISGNVNPIDVMLGGTPETVEKAVKECFRKGWGSPKGFVICTGCDTPMYAPFENIDAYMAAARKCAKYPVNPAVFAE